MTPIDWTATVSVNHMTEHDAVNLMLMSAGETPIASLDDNRNADAIQARQTLKDVSREVQLEGWHFNTEHGVKLLPAPPVPGEIMVPANAIRADVSPLADVSAYIRKDIIQRGNRLYDMENHTYLFEEPVTVTLTYFLPFEELPDSARAYISIKAARRFRVNVTAGDDGASMISREDEARARTTLMREHLLGADLGFNTPNRNTLLGHSSIGRVTRRRL